MVHSFHSLPVEELGMIRRAGLRFALASSLLLSFAASTAAQQSLHEQIDAAIDAAAAGPMAPQSDDAEFVRRVYLDLAGRIPTADEARAFFADGAADKRAQLIDRLLASDDHVNRMQQWLHVTLMERLGENAEWSRYLHDSVAANKSWDKLVRELLDPNPADEATRASAFFFSKRLENYGQNAVDVPALVRDVGRLTLGIDVQCAQCHDHLFVDDYKQEHYQGLLAFVGQLSLRSDVPFPAVTEKPLTKKLDFMSVFVQVPKSIGPQLPGGGATEIPVFAAGEEYELKPDPAKKEPGKLKFSTLRLLGEQLPTAGNQLFTRNIANRLWAMLLGRGLVHPLELQHAGNPPSHAAVLDLLASDLIAHQFDMRYLLREIATTRAYQRSSRMLGTTINLEEVLPQSHRLALEKPLLAEQLLSATLLAAGAKLVDDKQREEAQKKFIAAFANPPRDPEGEHHPAMRGSLLLMNDKLVLGWLEPRDANLVERLNAVADANALADELYLNVLTRLPTDDERTAVAAHLASHTDRRPAAIGQLVWALLASNEFGVNH